MSNLSPSLSQCVETELVAQFRAREVRTLAEALAQHISRFSGAVIAEAPDSMECARLLEQLAHLKDQTAPSGISLLAYREGKGLLRRFAQTAGGVLSAGGWCSVSVHKDAHVAQPRIKAIEVKDGWSDYRRARSPESVKAERVFVGSQLANQQVNALLTSSGMSALAAIFASLKDSYQERASLLSVEGIYRETAQLASIFFGEKFSVSPASHDTILSRIQLDQPSALLIETTPNAPLINPLQLESIATVLRDSGDRDVVLILDDACRGEPRAALELLRASGVENRILVTSSLLKMHQYGFDLKNSGFVLSDSSLEDIDRARECVGASLDDCSLLSIPTLWDVDDAMRARLTELASQRRAIIESGARLLAETFKEKAHMEVVHPEPRSQFVWLKFNNKKLSLDEVRQRCEQVGSIAYASDIPLVYGPSFGFDHGRIGPWSSVSSNLVRISAGVLNRDEMSAIKKLIVEVF